MSVTRRKFLGGAACAAVASRRIIAEVAGPVLLAGTGQRGAGKGIYAYRFDARTGLLTEAGLAAEAEAPTFLAISPDRRMAYAVNEMEMYEGKKSGSVSSYTIERGGLELKMVNRVPSVGTGPCYVSTDSAGKCVFVANYAGGSAASYQVGADGALSQAVSFFQFAGSGPAKRQESPHAHRTTVSPNQKFLLVNDLGLDQIHIFELDTKTAKLAEHEPSMWKATPGSGPRALRFHPNGRWAYCVAEMNSTVNVLHWDGDRGSLDRVQEISMVPDGYTGATGAAEIVFDRSGRFAYASNRINDFMATFTISPNDGQLTLVERSSCGGKTPRHIALDATGRWLLVANQGSDCISVFGRDQKTGKLAAAGKNYPIARPECLVWV